MRTFIVAASAAAFVVFAPALRAEQQAATPTPTPVPAATRQGERLTIEKVIVKVNGEILTQGQLEQMQVEAMQEQKRQVEDPKDLSRTEFAAALAEVTPGLLLDAVDELLMVQAAREASIRFTDETFKNMVENIKKDNKITNDNDFNAALKQAGLTLDELRTNLEKTYLIRGLQTREIMRNVSITEEELRQYYKANQKQFMRPPSVTVREILVSVPTETVAGQQTVNAAADEAAKAKAEALRDRAVKGEDFVKLVAEASDAGTKANGGLNGPVNLGDLNPVIASAIEPLKPGEISAPIRVRTGYMVLKLETRTGEEPEPFEKVRNQLGNMIGEQRLQVEQQKYLQKLRAVALIEWKDDGFKKMYEAAEAKRAKL
jgi:peptidyl-prolyl cis-trans isomerase SurA